jgi:hypothetical protein
MTTTPPTRPPWQPTDEALDSLAALLLDLAARRGAPPAPTDPATDIEESKPRSPRRPSARPQS